MTAEADIPPSTTVLLDLATGGVPEITAGLAARTFTRDRERMLGTEELEVADDAAH